MAKPPPVDVDVLAELWQAGVPVAEISARLGVPEHKINQLRGRRLKRGDTRFALRRRSSDEIRKLTLAVARMLADNPDAARRVTGRIVADRLGLSIWMASKILLTARTLVATERLVPYRRKPEGSPAPVPAPGGEP